MSKKTAIAELEGADLALWAARANGLEERIGIKLYATGPCLYRDTGPGGAPFAFRPDSSLQDATPLIYEMAEAGELTLRETGAVLYVDGSGLFEFGGGVTRGLTRCYLAWKLGADFTADATN